MFSKFTSEAMLLEGFLIALLTTLYLGFWILKKRRFGSAGQSLPSGPIREYLNHFIRQAEQLRIQLFGITPSNHLEPTPLQSTPSPQPVQSTATTSEISSEIKTLHQKMAEQAQLIASLTTEKQKLTEQIQSQEAAQQLASSTPGAQGQDIKGFKEQIKTLENKLAEYSIIEDDLAHLKRLQQENQRLKQALESQGKPIPAEAPPQTQAVATAQAKPSSKPVDPEPDLSSYPTSQVEKADADLVAEFEKMLQDT